MSNNLCVFRYSLGLGKKAVKTCKPEEQLYLAPKAQHSPYVQESVDFN